MYEIAVHAEFCAAHAITIAGTPEALHGHNFRVTARLVGDSLDDDGLLCDFHTIESTLNDILAPLANTNLNTTEPFTTTNPTAELVARYIADQLADRLDGSLAPYARVASVSITESPGCTATYSPQSTP